MDALYEALRDADPGAAFRVVEPADREVFVVGLTVFLHDSLRNRLRVFAELTSTAGAGGRGRAAIEAVTAEMGPRPSQPDAARVWTNHVLAHAMPSECRWDRYVSIYEGMGIKIDWSPPTGTEPDIWEEHGFVFYPERRVSLDGLRAAVGSASLPRLFQGLVEYRNRCARLMLDDFPSYPAEAPRPRGLVIPDDKVPDRAHWVADKAGLWNSSLDILALRRRDGRWYLDPQTTYGWPAESSDPAPSPNPDAGSDASQRPSAPPTDDAAGTRGPDPAESNAEDMDREARERAAAKEEARRKGKEEARRKAEEEARREDEGN